MSQISPIFNKLNAKLLMYAGDNIFGFDATDAAASMNAAFAPAVSSNIPWAAVLGNHDQESTLSRKGVMEHIVGMNNTLSQLNPTEDIDGFGNYNLEVLGVNDSELASKSVLNLFFLDSGDYSTVPSIPGYGWIKPSQQVWFQHTSRKLKVACVAYILSFGFEIIILFLQQIEACLAWPIECDFCFKCRELI